MIIRYFRDGKPRYGYRVSIANTNELIIQKCTELLEKLGIKYCSYTQDRGRDGLRRKKTHLIHITDKRGIDLLLKATTDSLVGKRKQAQLLQMYLDNWETVNKEDAYTSFRKLNKRIPR